jgi:stage II sporulation protein R
MKKILVILLIILSAISFYGCTSISNSYLEDNELVYEEIVDKIIRFHVIANSDTEEDQNLKLKVRDAVISYVYDKLKNSKSLDESREFINENKEIIEGIAKEVIQNNGYNYQVTSSLSRENFPDKVYGDIIFPQGEYEAYRILIGEAKGQNWWCVMFPPLCFLDETKETIDTSNIKENLDVSKEEEEKPIIFKFKIFDFIKNIFQDSEEN